MSVFEFIAAWGVGTVIVYLVAGYLEGRPMTRNPSPSPDLARKGGAP